MTTPPRETEAEARRRFRELEGAIFFPPPKREGADAAAARSRFYDIALGRPPSEHGRRAPDPSVQRIIQRIDQDAAARKAAAQAAPAKPPSGFLQQAERQAAQNPLNRFVRGIIHQAVTNLGYDPWKPFEAPPQGIAGTFGASIGESFTPDVRALRAADNEAAMELLKPFFFARGVVFSIGTTGKLALAGRLPGLAKPALAADVAATTASRAALTAAQAAKTAATGAVAKGKQAAEDVFGRLPEIPRLHEKDSLLNKYRSTAPAPAPAPPAPGPGTIGALEARLADVRRQLKGGVPDELRKAPGGDSPFAAFEMPAHQLDAAMERLAIEEEQLVARIASLVDDQGDVAFAGRAGATAAPDAPLAKPPAPMPAAVGGGAGGGKLDALEAAWNRGGVPKKPLRERFADVNLRLQEEFLDVTAGLRRLSIQTSGRAAARTTLEDLIVTRAGTSSAGAAHYRATAGKIVEVAEGVPSTAIDDVLALSHWEDVLRMKGDRRLLPTGFKSIEELRAAGAALRERLGEEAFTKAVKGAEIVRDSYQQMLLESVGDGLVSPELATTLMKSYPHYNPMNYLSHLGEGRDLGVTAARGITSGVRRLGEIGSEGATQRPLEALADAMMRHQARIHANRLNRSVIETLQQAGYEVKRTTNVRPVAVVDDATVFRPAPWDSPGTLSFWRDGVRESYTVPTWAHREMVWLMENYQPRSGAGMVIALANRITKAGAVSYNPAFVVANSIFDSVTAMIARGVLPHQVGQKLLQSLHLIRTSEAGKVFDLAGASQRKFFSAERTAKALAQEVGLGRAKVVGDSKDVLRAVRDALPTLGEKTERAPRQAVFDRTMDKLLPGWREMPAEQAANTWQAKRAAAEAIEATLNFSRGGHVVNQLDPYWLFLRAAVGGTVHPLRVLGVGGARIVGQEGVAATLRLSALMAGQSALTAYNLTYPEYLDIPDDVRLGTVVVMLPGEKRDQYGRKVPNYIVPVPLLREWTPFIGGTAWTMERLYAQDPAGFGEMAGVMWRRTSPIPEFLPLPPVMQEIYEQQANRDMYFGRPIVSADLENLPAGEQVNPYSLEASRLLAHTLGVPPNRVDSAIPSLLGGAALTVDTAAKWVRQTFFPGEVAPEVQALVEQYQARTTQEERDIFRRGLTLEQRGALDDQLRQVQVGPPVAHMLEKRFSPDRRGRITRQERIAAGEPVDTELGAALSASEAAQKARVASEIALATHYRHRLLQGDADVARRFREGYADISLVALAKERAADERYGSFATSEKGRAAYAAFWEQGVTPDYAAMGVLPRDAIQAAKFSWYDAYRIATKPDGVSLDYEALGALQEAAERGWNANQRAFMAKWLGTARPHSAPLIQQYEDLRAGLRGIDWYNYHVRSSIWPELPPEVQADFLSYTAALREGRTGELRWREAHTPKQYERAELIRKIVAAEREKAAQKDPRLEVGLAMFYGRVPRSTEAKATMAGVLPPDERLLVLTKGEDGARLSPENLLKLRGIGVRTLEDMAGASAFRVARALGNQPETVRKWDLDDQAASLLEAMGQ